MGSTRFVAFTINEVTNVKNQTMVSIHGTYTIKDWCEIPTILQNMSPFHYGCWVECNTGMKTCFVIMLFCLSWRGLLMAPTWITLHEL